MGSNLHDQLGRLRFVITRSVLMQVIRMMAVRRATASVRLCPRKPEIERIEHAGRQITGIR
jgi:hypothetical protein